MWMIVFIPPRHVVLGVAVPSDHALVENTIAYVALGFPKLPARECQFWYRLPFHSVFSNAPQLSPYLPSLSIGQFNLGRFIMSFNSVICGFHSPLGALTLISSYTVTRNRATRSGW